MESSSLQAWFLAETAYDYFCMYGLPICIMCCLSAMTVYRRQISCNHMYSLEAIALAAGEEDEDEPELSFSSSASTASQVSEDYYWPPHRSSSFFGIPTLFGNLLAFAAARLGGGEYNGEGSQLVGSTAPQQRSLYQLWEMIVQDVKNRTWTPSTTQALLRAVSLLLTRTVLRKQPDPSERNLRHPGELPPDVQVHILSYLHPKDVVTFGSTSRACREIVDGPGHTSEALWRALWLRDYGFIIHSWEIGRQALKRSSVEVISHSKEFYFRFGMSYINYLLAGHNTPEKCLVGLHGNIYDLTEFLTKHPGSPETLLVHAGQDATRHFDDMDHSRVARRMARDMCIVMDHSFVLQSSLVNHPSYGLRPTELFARDDDDAPVPEAVVPEAVITKRQRRLLKRSTLHRLYEEFQAEHAQHSFALNARYKSDKRVLGHCNSYYDPFRGEWRGWFTNTQFETVFV